VTEGGSHWPLATGLHPSPTCCWVARRFRGFDWSPKALFLKKNKIFSESFYIQVKARLETKWAGQRSEALAQEKERKQAQWVIFYLTGPVC
jgi:hypothetical protein